MKLNASPSPRDAPARGPASILPSAALVLIAIGALPGCALHTTTVCAGPASPSTGYQPHVEIFRGLGGWMPGSDRLQQRLAARGVSSSISCSAAAPSVSRRILERRARGNPTPIVLMGYATGGGGVKQVADGLARRGLCVDAIILIDPSFFEPVPRNVRYCFVAYRPEVWQSWNSIMRGNPVRTESPETLVRLVNLEESDSLGLLQAQSHVTITTDDWVQEILAQQAAGVFYSAGYPRHICATEE